MSKVAPMLWTLVALWLMTLFGIGMAGYGIAAIGGSVAVHIGGYHGAAATSTTWGRHIAATISTNYTGVDMSRDSTWADNLPGRYLQAGLTYQPNTAWMTAGLPLNVHTGTAGRIEQFFPGPPDHFE